MLTGSAHILCFSTHSSIIKLSESFALLIYLLTPRNTKDTATCCLFGLEMTYPSKIGIFHHFHQARSKVWFPTGRRITNIRFAKGCTKLGSECVYLSLSPPALRCIYRKMQHTFFPWDYIYIYTQYIHEQPIDRFVWKQVRDRVKRESPGLDHHFPTKIVDLN